MSEPKPVYTVVDPENLTLEQVEKLQRILSVFSLDQLLQLSERMEQLGFGVIHITVEKGHGRQMWADLSDKLDRPITTYAPE